MKPSRGISPSLVRFHKLNFKVQKIKTSSSNLKPSTELLYVFYLLAPNNMKINLLSTCLILKSVQVTAKVQLLNVFEATSRAGTFSIGSLVYFRVLNFFILWQCEQSASFIKSFLSESLKWQMELNFESFLYG